MKIFLQFASLQRVTLLFSHADLWQSYDLFIAKRLSHKRTAKYRYDQNHLPNDLFLEGVERLNWNAGYVTE